MTIAIAMSGGVDSSTAAALLAENNSKAPSGSSPEVVGLTMQLWNQRRLPQLLGEEAGEGGHASGRCCSLDDVYDARAVANFLNIPYYVINLEKQFESRRGAALRGGLPGRRDAHPVQPLQYRDQVRAVPHHGAADRRGAHRHRPLRAHPARPEDRPLPTPARRRSFEGPGLLPLWTDAGAVGALGVSPG